LYFRFRIFTAALPFARRKPPRIGVILIDAFDPGGTRRRRARQPHIHLLSLNRMTGMAKLVVATVAVWSLRTTHASTVGCVPWTSMNSLPNACSNWNARYAGLAIPNRFSKPNPPCTGFTPTRVPAEQGKAAARG